MKEIFQWVLKPIELKFYIGEFTIFSITFPFLVLNVHPTKLKIDPDKPQIPFEEFSHKAEGAMIYSFPIEKNYPRFNFLPKLIRYVPKQYHRYYVDFSKTKGFDDYLNNFSSKSRATLKRKIKKFSESSKGNILIREFHKQQDMEEFYNLARKLSKETYQEKLLHKGFPSDKEFLQFLFNSASNDRIRGYALYYKDAPIAYQFHTITEEGIVLYDHVGYAPEFRYLSPGTVLLYLALEKLFNENKFQMLDFTEGEGMQKQFFANTSMLCANVYYFRRNLKNFIILLLHSIVDSFSSSVVKLLALFGIKSYIKNFFRFGKHV
jgi:hypothetical protein